MDTIQYEATTLTAHVLYSAKFLVAEPRPDIQGTDLLAFMEMADGAKFCRIQVKGRDLKNSDSDIKVPCDYVTNAFIVVLYVRDELGDPCHYCFLANEVRAWAKTPDESEYRLGLSRNTHRDKLKGYVLDDTRIGLIRLLVSAAEIHNEFRVLTLGSVRVSLGALSVHVTGMSTPPGD